MKPDLSPWLVRVLRLLQQFAAHFPYPAGLSLAALIGDICYLFIGKARRQAIANLTRVFAYNPEGSPPRPVDAAQLRRAVRHCFRNQVINYYDLLRMPVLTPEGIDATIALQGMDYATNAIKQGNGLILVTCHLGLIDYGPLPVAVRGMPIVIPVEPMQNKQLFDFLSELRTSQGYQILPSEPKVLRQLLKALRENKVLAMVADRDIHGTGVPVTFFGARTTMPSGPALLALRTKTPIIHAICPRERLGHYSAIVHPPLAIDDLRTGDFEADVAAVMQRIAHQFEQSILAYPEQWAAFNQIWRD